MAVPILDNHMHLEPFRGGNVNSVRDFERHGGTHLIISHLPYEEVHVQSAEDFRRSFDLTISIKDRVNEETGVKAYATVGPYPVELLRLEKIHSLEKAKEIMIKGMDIAAEYVREGSAIAIGEVGRPHFPISTEAWVASNEIMQHAMALAKENGCAIVLHTEHATPESMKQLAEMADRAGLDRGKVVKHYCPPLIRPIENFGLMPSVLAGKDAIKEALEKGTRFMMETDFLDDPRRPGAVLAIATVPKRTVAFIQQGLMTEEQAYVIHHENPLMTYGDAFGQ
ncbi:MAG: TatD family hydrolase [Candidatus Thermoplasmatota archaeon]|nr:TatD family hydrolase [Candidatus Thermoplasmatota archaeon]